MSDHDWHLMPCRAPLGEVCTCPPEFLAKRGPQPGTHRQKGGGSVSKGEFKPFLYTPRPGVYQVVHMGEVIFEHDMEFAARAWFDRLMGRKDWRERADLLAGLKQQNIDITPREDVLNEAAKLITGDRNQTYGSPTQNFTDTANIWSIILRNKLRDGARIEPGEVASMMVGLKLARQPAQPKRDNWTDIAGYAGCGYECDVETGRISE